jgi:predicted TIM-barrel fold metal-dependent hydrolase
MIFDLDSHVLLEYDTSKIESEYVDYVPMLMEDRGGRTLQFFNGRTFPDVPEGVTMRSGLADPDKRVKDLDRAGIGKQVLLATVGSLFYNVPPIDLEAACALSRMHNRHLSEFVQQYPDRFIGAAVVPLQNGQAAASELEYAYKDLGLKAVEICTHVDGKNIDSPDLSPFYEKASELNVPIMVHTDLSRHIKCAAADRLDKYFLANLFIHPFEIMISMACLIGGGVLDRFPKLRFCFLEASVGFLPYLMDRFEERYEKRPETKSFLQREPKDYLRQLFFAWEHQDTSLQYVIERLGCDSIVVGTDYPHWDSSWMTMRQDIEKMNISEQDKRKILSENAERLFGMTD